RPTTSYICDELSRLHKILRYYRGVKDKDELAILNAFQSADAIIPTLSTELSICPQDKLTSKLLNFKNLSEPVNSSLLASKYIEVATLDLRNVSTSSGDTGEDIQYNYTLR
ncbi:13586_t:CDS:2, partial [Gigaspora rosea]